MYNPVSWRSKVYDRIGRAIFGEPPSKDFYYIEGDRVLEQTHASFIRSVHANLLRRDLRALVSCRMLILGIVLGAICWWNAGEYTGALSQAIHWH
ncbi:hypothetical protein OVY01_11775 [Robbsia sp. Bb-Pol-6]|uniref:Uncharacterized protein n=1 Tax=Robbsia betulipollinis TaxID=2981849 RepID=A0ABT3ZPP9_9BURK|nr:hypothetical protein [Robbsia betulipollinis]MCY0387903.1 hypothetical protein [Robbsia betulipollinis]